LFPITLTLSLRRREQQGEDLFFATPVPQTSCAATATTGARFSLSPGERAGVRGTKSRVSRSLIRIFDKAKRVPTTAFDNYKEGKMPDGRYKEIAEQSFLDRYKEPRMNSFQDTYKSSIPMREPRSFKDWESLVEPVCKNGIRNVIWIRHDNSDQLKGSLMLKLWQECGKVKKLSLKTGSRAQTRAA